MASPRGKGDSGGSGDAMSCVGELPSGVRVLRELKNDWFALTSLVEIQGKTFVLKASRFGPRKIPLLDFIGGYLNRREINAYKALAGLPGIPGLYPVHGKNYFMHEYVQGENIAKKKDVDVGFLDRLESLVNEIHARGVALLDISKRENIIWMESRKPVLVDFQISFIAGSGLVSRALFRCFKEIDLYHVRKRRDWLKRRMGDTSASAHHGRDAPLLIALHRVLVRRVWLFFKRKISVKGAGESRPGA